MAGLILCIIMSKTSQFFFFDLVKTAIFFRNFFKLRFFYARPSEAETGTRTSTQDIGSRSEVVIIGADRLSGRLAKNFRRISIS